MAHDPKLPLELGDGLVLRQSRIEDTEQLAAFNADVHRGPGPAPEPAAWVAAWTRDLMRGNHPTHSPDCFTLVEERATGRIVSALNLISQTWSYGGVPIGVGRVELVGTAPDHRRQGLIRRQMEVVHRWSAERGELVTAITGIPWYYRQFGYEYALEHSHARMLAVHTVPPADAPAFRLRDATELDAPLCAGADRRAAARSLVTCQRDEATWRYEIAGRDAFEPKPPVVKVVERTGGEPVGYVVHNGRRDGPELHVRAVELAEGVGWHMAAPAIVRGLIETAQGMGEQPLAELALMLEREHPLYDWLPGEPPRRNRGYAWYLRVPDLPAFLWRIAPVLEQRADGYTGELKLWFYRSGLRLAFEDGRLAAIEGWTTEHTRQATAAFPELTFLQLLFGYRSMQELTEIYPDCFTRAREGAAALMDRLFPKSPSNVNPLD